MELREVLPTLKAMPIFNGLPDSALSKVLTAGVRQVSKPGTILMGIGEEADCFFLILRGRLEIRDKEGQPFAALEDGQVVGEMGLFAKDTRRNAEVVVTRDAILFKVGYERMTRLFEKDAAVAAKFKSNLRDLAAVRAKRGTGLLPPLPPVPGETEEPSTQGDQNSPAPPVQGIFAIDNALPDFLKAKAAGSGPLVPIQIKMALSRCPLFEGFSSSCLDLLLGVGEPIRREQYQMLMREGEEADCLYVVALGRLGIVARGGAAHDLVAQVAAGSCVGELPLAFSTKRRFCSVITLTAVSLVRITYDEITAIVNRDPEMTTRFGLNLAGLIADRI